MVLGLRLQPSKPANQQRWVIYTDKAQQELADSPPLAVVPSSDRFCQLDSAQRNGFLSLMRNHVLSGALHQLPAPELLRPVSQYNIILAMASNAAALGLSMDALRHDILSPFNTSQPLRHTLPPTLRPTPVQRTVPHHPWIDLCPLPSVRDTMLYKKESYDEDELCHDLFGGVQGQVGLFIWGEAWDPTAYELSEAALRKYWWLFKGCADLLGSTNRWRRSRGEKSIAFGTRVTEISQR